MITYECQPQQVIQAHYDSAINTQSPSSAHLLIDGVEYDLSAKSIPKSGTANSALYETDIGITNDAGMTWQVAANKATLVNKTLDASVAADDEKVLFECQHAPD
jgi:hypothetical protein